MSALSSPELRISGLPVTRLKSFRYMIENSLAIAAELKEIDKEIQATVDDSIEFAESSPDPDPNFSSLQQS
jgi:pyruvate dehydrogenase E1 component alpha subunit